MTKENCIMDGCLTSKETVEKYITGCDAKVNMPAYKLLIKAVMAGAMIALGAAGSNVAAHNISNVGLSRLVAGVVFPMGLMMVVMMGAELFTGDCLMIMGTVEKKHRVTDLIRVLCGVYVGNLVGGILIAAMAYYCGQFNYTSGLLGAYTIRVAAGKTALDFGPALVSGILCNILVCAAVLLALSSKDVTGKLLACFFIILLFVTSGYEHCVANMYYISAGLFAKLNPDYVAKCIEAYGMTQAQIDGLSIGGFVMNLIPVTIGNIIGGSVCVGLPMVKTK